jgi:diguanylate cyclase (GGDEF)-like protein
VGCLLSATGFWLVRKGTENEIRNDFQLASATRIQVVQRELDDNLGVLQVLRAYFETSKDEGPEAFDKFASQSVTTYRSLRSLEWAPRVRDPDRGPFEARLRSQWPGATGIVAANANGKLARAFSKSEYYPIEYVSFWNKEPAFAGYDVSSNPATAGTVKQAILTGQPASTGKLKLGERPGGGYGVTTFLAVYDAPDKGKGAEWRQQHCRGLVISTLQTGELLAAALRNFSERSIRTYVFDLSAAGPRQLLYMQPLSAMDTVSDGTYSPETLLQARLVYGQKIPAGGREWQIICVGSDAVSTSTNWQPMVFLLCALSVTAAAGLYLHMLSRYTSDLATANVDLRNQVQDRQRAQDELAFQAFHDPLTGLPNRRQFGQRFNEAIEQAKQTKDSLALFYVDLDGFKLINDSLGHAVGDAVLKAVAERFTKNVGKRDVVARTGGDEFNILLVEAGPGNLADRVAQGLLDSLNKPIEVGGRVLTLSASIGISLYPAHGQDFQELSHCSDAAMYFAKKRGKNRYHRYTKELAVNTRKGMELALSLRGAIGRSELSLFFQPILGMGSEGTLRFEALLRWKHPQMGLLGPGHFLSIAEETGLTAPIGRWVLHEACRHAATWQRMGHRPIGVSVNVSGLHFAHPEFMSSVDSALAESPWSAAPQGRFGRSGRFRDGRVVADLSGEPGGRRIED